MTTMCHPERSEGSGVPLWVITSTFLYSSLAKNSYNMVSLFVKV